MPSPHSPPPPPPPPPSPPSPPSTPNRQIRALYDTETITLYQAYPQTTASAAVGSQQLAASPAFSPTRMTWIKPSWAWMMYRSGYSFKDAGQERVLAIRMRHVHFRELLGRAVVHGRRKLGVEEKGKGKEKGVRVQWDPERTVGLEVLPYRSIQVGVSGDVGRVWREEWIVGIEDVTGRARRLKEEIEKEGGWALEELVEKGLVPEERVYDVPDDLRKLLQMDE